MIVLSILAINDAYAQRRGSINSLRKYRKISAYTEGSIHFDKNKRYLSGGISLDATNYFGDLAPKSEIASTDISFTRPGASIFVSYRYAPNITFRGSFSWARLKGDDFESADPYGENSRFRYVRNASFRNDIKELAFIAVWDIFGNHGTFLNRLDFTPYIFVGAGILHHNPKAIAPDFDKFGQPLEEAGEWVALQPLGTEGQFSEQYDVKKYSRIQPSIPLGIGIRALLNKRWDFEFEVGYRYLFTDYIDDVSGMYVDLGSFGDNELAKAMSDRTHENIAVNSGKARDFEAIGQATSNLTYTSEYDNRTYNVYAGYAHEHPDSNRGLSEDKDIYIVTSMRISYIITGSFKKAKFR
jgi:hypothetical protein